MSWSVLITIGGSTLDISDKIDLRTIKRSARLHNELKPTTSKCELTALFDPTLFARLCTSREASITIDKDGSRYFTGVLSPNYQAKIVQGRKTIALIAEDYNLAKLGQVIQSPLAYISHSVCNPASTSTSLVHKLAALAGVTLASGEPTIMAAVPLLSVVPDDKATYGSLIEKLLFEYGYSYRFLHDGTLKIFQAINPAAVSTSFTFSSAAGTGNIRGELSLKKKPERYDDIRVKFDSIELKSGIILFEDRSGATGSLDCSIPLTANAYYPPNSGTIEVFSEWKSPDGFTIRGATSVAIDSTVEAGIELSRALTNYYKRASFAYHNPGATTKYLTRLRLVGDAYVVSAQNVARSAADAAKLLLEYEAAYIYDELNAAALARSLRQYYAYSDLTLSLRSHEDRNLGEYVLVSDPAYSGITQLARIVGKAETTERASISYELEAVADYSAAVVSLEGVAAPTATNTADQLNRIANDSLIAPQEKNLISVLWQSIDGDGSTSGSYWATRAAAIRAGVGTDEIDGAHATLLGLLFTSPGVLKPETWGQNITVDPVAFSAAFADYYQAESATTATTVRYASFGGFAEMDCGVYDGSAPIILEEYDGGDLPDISGGYIFPRLVVDCGEY